MDNIYQTSLFLLFKEYADSNKISSNIYIESDSLVNSDIFLHDFDKWIEIVEFFQHETCNRYYDSKNIKSALYPYEILKNEYNEQDDEYPNTSFYVMEQLKRLGIIDWREEIGNIPNESYHFYNCNVTNDTLGKIAEQKKELKACILLNCGAIQCSNPIVLTCQSKQNVTIEHTNNLQELYHWFCKCRIPQRVFVYNPKHGDNKHIAQFIAGTQRQAAQLEISCEKAQQLLHLAVGIDPKSPLWLYDESIGKYIYFENQQEIRLAFHGYHLQPGEENYNNIDKKKLQLIQQVRK